MVSFSVFISDTDLWKNLGVLLQKNLSEDNIKNLT